MVKLRKVVNCLLLVQGFLFRYLKLAIRPWFVQARKEGRMERNCKAHLGCQGVPGLPPGFWS